MNFCLENCKKVFIPECLDQKFTEITFHFLQVFWSCIACKECLKIIRTLILLSIFAVNFHAFNFKPGEVWGHFWIARFQGYLKMPSNFTLFKIKGMKIDSKKTQQIRIFMRQSLLRLFFGHFEKNSRPKKLKPKKTQANFRKTQAKHSKSQ